jgi:hypothetical protein
LKLRIHFRLRFRITYPAFRALNLVADLPKPKVIQSISAGVIRATTGLALHRIGASRSAITGE